MNPLRLIQAVAALVLFALPSAAQPPAGSQAGDAGAALDSSSRAEISAKVTEYLDAIAGEPVNVQQEEIDFLIETCSDSLVRQAVALDIYSYYLDSKIMGVEALAVYVCDKWFIPGKIKMENDMDLMGAKMFAEFNRNSLIGMQAPGLTLLDSLGNEKKLFAPAGGPDLTHDGGKRYSILYFYATDCARCRMETIMLRNILENDNLPVDFYAIYTGKNRPEWMRYVRLQMDIDAPQTRIFHLWDPDMSSGLQMAYGILQTPGLFLVTPDGKIAGRRLDAVSLEKLLKTLSAPEELEYGGDDSGIFYDSVFMPFGDSIRCADIKMVAEHIDTLTRSKGDTLLFKQMTGDLMYYLAKKRGQAYKCALSGLIKKQILGSDAWRTQDDTLKVISFASILDDLLSKSPQGKKIPRADVEATLRTCGPGGRIISKDGIFRTDRLGGRKNYIIFHTEGCPICKAEIQAADTLLSSEGKGTKVLLIDMDMLFSSYPEKADLLFDRFDLTALPFIISTDRKGTVTGKYISLASEVPSAPGQSSQEAKEREGLK